MKKSTAPGKIMRKKQLLGDAFFVLKEKSIVLTGSDHSGEEDVQRGSVVVDLRDGINEDGDIAADVVHDEQEDSNADGANVYGHDLHDHGE